MAPPERVVDLSQRRTPAKGKKFIKTRILADDGDLVWGVIEVDASDKRKGFDPNTQTVHNRTTSEALKGNPMASKPMGDNDVEVTGL